MRMHNPAHPGEISARAHRRDAGEQTCGSLGVSRVTLSRLLNGNSGVSAEMALKLSEALGTSPELWLNMQTQFDLWQVSRQRRKKIAPLAAA